MEDFFEPANETLKMSTLEYRLQDSDYKNWVKSGLCLALVKEGLEEYADIKSKEFHAAVLSSVAKIPTLQTSVCDNERISFDRKSQGNITCHHAFCQGFLDAIVHEGIDTNQKFTIRKSNIDNCNVKLWHTDPWELAKFFMNPGQKPNQKKPSQTDLSGILNFLDHNDIARKGIHNIQHIDEVRKARNSVLHTYMKVSLNDFTTFTQSMVDLLSDSKVLAQLPSAQKAASEIQRVADADFHITKENEFKILQELCNDLRTKNELIRVQTNVGQKLKEDELEKELKIREMLERSLQALGQKIKGDAELVRMLDTEVNTMGSSLKETRHAIADLTSRMEKGEREREQLKRKQDHIADIEIVSKKYKKMDTPSITEQRQSEIYTRTGASANSTPEEPSPKRKREDDVSDPLYTTINKRNYYDTTGKKGYLLILNSKTNRKDTDKDVANIKGFFEERLKFDTFDPRSYEGADLSTEELVNYLKSTQESLNGALSKKYYCFVCIILYHGNEDNIATRDGIKSVNEIIKMFNNDQIPNFAGRPKLFFIQACRGISTNAGVVVDDADDMNEDEVEDEADELVRVPHEADTLIAYATTHGKKALRRSGIGSWFISESMKEFTENYKTDHVEEMLITVREKVSQMHSPNLETMQMPCVQSTLTRRLLLK